MSARYRPEPRWLLLGPLLGAVSGSVVGFVLLLGGILLDGSPTSPGDVLSALGPFAVLAVVFGGLSGAVVGVVAGVPLVFLAGRHLSRTVARQRAFVLGMLLPPVAMVAVLFALSGEVLSWGLSDWWGVLPFLGASLLGGPLAARAETRLLPHDDVS